jgi:hypothetical protein
MKQAVTRSFSSSRPPRLPRAPGPPTLPRPHGAVRAAQRMNRAAGLLAVAVLADSALEHYRGAFHNPGMVAPLLSGCLSLAVSAQGNADPSPTAHRVRDVAYVAAALTGLTGTAFHLYNVTKRPGGWSWQNLFYGAPLGAPAALTLCGVLGWLAERVRETPRGRRPRGAAVRVARAVAGASALGLAGTIAEVGMLHFRGAYHSRWMYLPVSIPPLSAALIGAAAVGPARRPRTLTRWLLRLTGLLGPLGVFLHLRGVSRGMGGWRNLRQNVLNGPPVPAPPSFTALALAGLAALGLLEDRPDG